MPMSIWRTKIAVLLLICCLIDVVDPVKCNIGWGQRGLKSKNSIIWPRNCPDTDYCFEAVTKKMRRIERLIDYPWVNLPHVVLIWCFVNT